MPDSNNHGLPARKAAIEPGLAFFGRITAGATHELNNVLSIIEQLTGLIEDQLAAAAAGRPLDLERLAGVPPRIVRQVDRGTELLRHLNRFAHTVDPNGRQVELNEVVNTLHPLCLRFANLARVDFRTESAAAAVLLEAPPFPLLHALFELVLASFEVAEREESILLAVQPADAGAGVHLSGPPVARLAEGCDGIARAKAVAEPFGGTIRIQGQGAGRELVLHLPAVVVENVD